MSANPAMLAEVPIFSLLDQDERETLAELLERVTFKAGATIFRVGDHPDALYVVSEGAVQLFLENDAGQKVVVSEVAPGEALGLVSFMDGGARTATAVALADTALFRFERDALLEFVTRHPHAALDLLGVMAQRLRRAEVTLRHNVVRNANEEADEQLTFGERVADRVATFGGSWTFIGIFFSIMFCWMLLNVKFLLRPFDPYPFILLNLMLSLVAAIQAPVIMMSQNRQAAKDRVKSDLDYQVNAKAELEIGQLHKKIDELYEVVQLHWAEREKEKRAGAQGKPQNDYY